MSEITIKGIYRDQLWDPSHKLIFDSDWRSNLIVMNCRILLAGFIKNDLDPDPAKGAKGIQYMEVGFGESVWDTNPPDTKISNTTSSLVNPSPNKIKPPNFLKLHYLDENEVKTSVPTNRIEIVATLGPGQPTPATDPPYQLREFGLFGMLNNTPYMIDYVRHPLIEKDGALTLERRVRLIF